MFLLVDSNVLLRIIESRHAHHAAAVKAIESLDSLGHELVVVPQVVYEFWAVATRPVSMNGLGLTTGETKSKLDSLLSTLRVMRDERRIYERWQQMVVQYDVNGKQVHDARLVAAMLRHDISHLLTFNSPDFARYTEITVVEPQLAAALPAAT